MGIGVGWVIWDFFSDRYVLRTVLKGHRFPLRALTNSQALSCGFSSCLFLPVYFNIMTSVVMEIYCFAL